MKTLLSLMTAISLAIFGTSLYYKPPHLEEIDQWDGENYRENALLQEGWANKFFFQKYSFAGDEYVLDIGSGDGKLTARIAQGVPGGYVMGIDKSDSMLDVARRERGDVENLDFVFQDADDASFYQKFPEKFDLVVSFTVLHWIKNQLNVLRGIREVLRPGGTFYIRICSKGGDPIQNLADEMYKSSTYQSHFTHFVDPMTRFSPEEYRYLLKKAHLHLVYLKDVEEQDQIMGKEKLIKQLKSWLPHYHYLKNQEKEALAESFMEDLVERYLALYPPKADQTIILYDHYLEVIGRK